jgi:hypothetical protein
MAAETVGYPYKQKLRNILFACLLFGAGSLLMFGEAITNRREMILNGIFHFSVQGATAFYWTVCAVCTTFVAFGLLRLTVGFKNGPPLMLTAAQIIVPPVGFSREPRTVELADIKRITVSTVYGQRFLNVYHSSGKLTIAQSLLPDPAAFDELCSNLTRRAPASASRR